MVNCVSWGMRLSTGSYVHVEVGAPKDQSTGYGYLVSTECARIIPESTYFGVGKTTEGNNKRDYAASVLAVLQRFGYDVEKLNGPNVHSLINVITLEHNVHHDFDTLQLWLDATDTPNQYCIGAVSSDDIPPGRSLVTFSTTNKDLPLPSAQLLALHAACAKVANLSGAAEYLDDVERRSRELKVLASDGGSAAVLEYAIAGLVGGEIQVGASTQSTTEP
ncbi:hypothetical protein ONZ45_g8672 [Pleurotus djamor]|nr:hypothetical protein ONZ45_g8672 [Pleurotus djamor]